MSNYVWLKPNDLFNWPMYLMPCKGYSTSQRMSLYFILRTGFCYTHSPHSVDELKLHIILKDILSLFM